MTDPIPQIEFEEAPLLPRRPKVDVVNDCEHAYRPIGAQLLCILGGPEGF